MPKHRVPKILSAADACLVHLKKADLFKRVLPSKIFEMAAMAKPIILGVEGCAAEVIAENNEGLTLVEVRGRPLFLYVEGEPEEAQYLLNAVAKEGIRMEVRPAAGIPGRLQDTKWPDGWRMTKLL